METTRTRDTARLWLIFMAIVPGIFFPYVGAPAALLAAYLGRDRGRGFVIAMVAIAVAWVLFLTLFSGMFGFGGGSSSSGSTP